MHISTTSIFGLLAVLPNLALAECDYGLMFGKGVKFTKPCTLGPHSTYHCGNGGGTLGKLFHLPSLVTPSRK